MEKIKDLLTSDYMVKLYRIICYAIVEVLSAGALIELLEARIADQYVYGLVIIVIVAIRNALKSLLGEESALSKVI